MAAALRAVKPNPALAPLAARFARFFYAVGDVAAATPWADLAIRSGSGAAVWPYRALLGRAGSGEFAKWEKQARLDPGRQERIAAIVSAFGIGSPEGFSDVAARTPPPEPEPDDLRAVDEAAARQHVGETTSRALAVLGRNGPARANPDTLHWTLAAIDRVNLHDEARALAFEAITATLVGR